MKTIKTWAILFIIAILLDIFCVIIHDTRPLFATLIIQAQCFISVGIAIVPWIEGKMSFLKFLPNLIIAIIIAGIGLLTVEICSNI